MPIIKYVILFKKALPVMWSFLELINGILFKLIFFKKVKSNASHILRSFENEKYAYRLLAPEDIEYLFEFFQRQNQPQYLFFNPHNFDKKSLKRLFNNPSIFLFGVFDGNKLIGYFILRCYNNKKCFIGRLVDEVHQNQGIAKNMGKILHQIAWKSNFRIFSTISKENVKSLNSYQAFIDYKVIAELDNKYLYIEFLETKEKHLK